MLVAVVDILGQLLLINVVINLVAKVKLNSATLSTGVFGPSVHVNVQPPVLSPCLHVSLQWPIFDPLLQGSLQSTFTSQSSVHVY